MIRTYALAALATVAILATPAMAATELVTNGGFETVTNGALNLNAATTNFQVDPGNPYGGVTGWTTSNTPSGNPYNILFKAPIATTGNAVGEYSASGKEYLYALPSNTTSRGNFMALDGDTGVNGTFFTILTGLVVGNTYDLVFDWATGQLASRTGPTTDSLNVQVGNLNFTTAVVATASGSSTPWNTVTRQFQATSVNQTLSFLSLGTPNGGPPVALLDNVSVKAAVPEPSTWAMMLIGFGMVGAGLRRRRRTTLMAAA